MKKRTYQIEIGERFSYPGSFKIYKAVTKPDLDPEFDCFHKCKHCHSYRVIHQPRLKFRVTDEGTQGEIGIRLRASVMCTIHTEDEFQEQVARSRRRST